MGVGMIIDQVIGYIDAQTWESFFVMFWFVILIEFPRFILGGIVAMGPLVFYMSRSNDLENVNIKVPMSVLIPGHNNGDSIVRTVMSLVEQIGVELQIIVINDGSTDDTDMHCRELLRRGFISDYIQTETRGGKASALNAGFLRVKYNLVVATDADTMFFRDALVRTVKYFNDPKVGALCGNLRVRNLDASLCSRMQQLNYVAGITIARIVKDMLSFYFVISGAFGVYRASAIEEVGGWNYGPGDDGDMSVQIRLSGWRVRFAALAVATTTVPETFAKLARQRVRWNRSMIRVRYRKYAKAILNPFNKNFNFLRTLSFYETYLVQGLVPLLFVIYVFMLIFGYGSFSIAVLIAIHVFYMVMFFIEYLFYLIISPARGEDAKLIWCIPLYPFFHSYFLRMVTLYSIFNELIKRGSYEDEFYPKKVRKRVKKF
jgi:poly-beta-1,6-N-acetyl-D-glucosamine synthase